MEKYNLKIWVIVAAITCGLGACKKEAAPENDYRDKYVGEYHFSNEAHSLQDGYNPVDSTHAYDGVVELGLQANTVFISISSKNKIEVEVTETGELGDCVFCVHNTDYQTSGAFDGDGKLELMYSHQGEASGFTYAISGEKK